MSANAELLEIYAACATSADVIAAQQAHLAGMQADHDEAALRKGARACALNPNRRDAGRRTTTRPPCGKVIIYQI